MKKLLLLLACALAFYHYQQASPNLPADMSSGESQNSSVSEQGSSAADSAALSPAQWRNPPALDASTPSLSFDASFDQQQIQGSGQVVNILSDDNSGSRHQRFILQLPSGQTVLVAHNIDLAPRVPDLAIGDQVEFVGEFVWNEQGGVEHWTHQDPAQRHPPAWLQVAGQRYQ